ncbi:reverse transcriptase N-terminal domain-containing protein [Acidithiobacillus ferrivorans]|uniref:reverse transcriptase N-terminal domain-containing protein n=1 Tax=Acidithiobacillus ferrivorans TaxID=160808 RepID=UPI001E56F1EF|nr:reverse transcriptase N-terminal domain-containing protein [Acidithiobacillus ferrivorans]
MNARTSACAPSHGVDWHGIDWSLATKQVRRLQARIVKATQEGRWGKVKALQHLLTHSYSGKVLAVRRVTSNQGKNTPGGTGQPGHPRKTKRRPCCHFGGGDINPFRSNGCTSPRRTAKNVLSVSPR